MFVRKSSTLQQRGRLDVKQRTVPPREPSGDFHGVAPVSTEWHPTEIMEVCRTGAFHNEPPNAYEVTPLGAPVARLTRVPWLTPAEVAVRLQVCRATIYKLCDAGRAGLSL
jgi:hypothetical protein